ncbi:CGCGG family rSAM-modified RiPP protein [Bacillus sp. DNRA2]|uniref:CGCGG family putative rSAM-modified RiPP protein n=1 Tax=Bacillus sp. DNRA2 TaxID=2723053 RepID=UPI00145DBFF4|nr:CGCGG family rSAM-modified RiPP protein [Bacillus sp. DNRA2]NMD71647.1 CGCGG family rSAM-modified RiPP protein [Bacillus sp. DNRA2]
MKQKNWSISLEHDEYEGNLELVIKEALGAVEKTASGCYVNLVTPEGFGQPDLFLSEPLISIFGNTIEWKFIDQCGCGGYVLRVWKL